MSRKFEKAVAVLTSILLLPSLAVATTYESYLQDGTIPSLKEWYAGKMEIGIPAEVVLSTEKQAAADITSQCGLLICEEQCRGKNLLDRAGSKKKKDQEHARLIVGEASEALNFALEHGMRVRSATVIQPDNIPEWFFNEDWADTGNAQKAEREIIIQRMENAVHDQIMLFNEKYQELITEWEVVRDGQKNSDLFRETIGKEYVLMAFKAARETAAEEQKLVWGLTDVPKNETMQLIQELHSQGCLDGIVLDCSLSGDEEEYIQLEETLAKIDDTGMEIHLSGVEISGMDRTANGQIRLAILYRRLFSLAMKYHVQSIAFPELQDAAGREKGTPPRLINEKGRFTPAFFGALQDDSIPLEEDEETMRVAIKRLDLETVIKKEADPVVVYKKTEDHNPVMTQRFGADPWAMVYKDRVYLYMTGDEPAYEPGKKPKTNDYGNIVTLRVLSSDDLVNWTDHGSVCAAGKTGAAKWASNSWAPCAAWKTIDGKDKFFLYFANSGGGIGVLTSDSPSGPFTDPIGEPLVSRNTPTCASVTWLFDPAVLTDEDGSAYLYFGGGVPDGKQADPGTARVVRLGKDMISLDGDPVTINPPWLFEDSGINKFGNIYVYSYCTNFNVPATGSPQGFSSGEIVFMTSDNPLGPFAYAGQILKNPGVFFCVGGNNHHCMFNFRDQWYITYHAATIDKAMGWNAGYRSTFVDRLALNADGLPAPTKGTIKGVDQVKTFNPYDPVQGATAVSMAGVTTELVNNTDKKYGTGPMKAISTAPDGWVAVAGADFGKNGAVSVRLMVQSEVPAKIEILTDSNSGEPEAILEIPACEEEKEVSTQLAVPLTGKHDIYFRFTESGTSLLEWQFR